MNSMKKTAICLLTCWAALQTFVAQGEWLTELPKAQAKAKAENKIVLMDFTGSDWCGWCIKFNKEVLSTPEFAEYAKKNLVLVELDFPRKKQQPAELKKANKALQAKFQVDGFPTFVVLNAEGKEIGKQVGYSEGGAKPFISKLEGFKKKPS
jgi:thioredoxin-related protein